MSKSNKNKNNMSEKIAKFEEIEPESHMNTSESFTVADYWRSEMNYIEMMKMHPENVDAILTGRLEQLKFLTEQEKRLQAESIAIRDIIVAKLTAKREAIIAKGTAKREAIIAKETAKQKELDLKRKEFEFKYEEQKVKCQEYMAKKMEHELELEKLRSVRKSVRNNDSDED